LFLERFSFDLNRFLDLFTVDFKLKYFCDKNKNKMALKETKNKPKKQIRHKFTRKLLRQWVFCYGSPRPPETCSENCR